jgi:ribosomal peptide maturation radical SAM protein 1
MNKTDNLDVLLINMPFGLNFMPSLGLSLLKEAVRKKGFTSYIKYYTLKFTKLIGAVNYVSISEGTPADLLGEWVFAGTLFPNQLPDQGYINNILHGSAQEHFNNARMRKNKTWKNLSPEESIDLILDIKSKAEPFINSCLEEVKAIKPKIVGFSTIFQQNTASLALAKWIKESLPETTIVFGGANCEDEMGKELIKKFPFIDIVVSGEGDDLFPELVSRIINQEDYNELPGVICKDNLHLHSNGVISSPMVKDMDALPIPDYDDYFEQFEYYNLTDLPRHLVLFESSRGCWWGEKSHCTFCGLNGSNMMHRSKSSARLIEEIKFLKDKYKVTRFSATDNILDLAHFKDFIPALANENLNLRIFYEVKSNLTKDQLRLLKAANIMEIQPGIESFNTHILDLMKKGVKSIQNVQLLKWSKEYGISVAWNIIWGFPGETNEDYYEMAALVPKISHLFPPSCVSSLIIHRFSPNFNYPEKFGIKDIHPVAAYNYVYPFEYESIYNLAYQFSYKYEAEANFEQALDAVRNALVKWKVNSREIDLFFIDQEDALIVFDLRLEARQPYHILYAKERFLYLLCDGIKPFQKIKAEYAKFFETEADETEINIMLDSLTDKDLMIRENNSYLSLAIPLGTYSPNQEIMKKLVMTLKNRPEGDNQVMITENNELLIELSG